MRSTYCLLVVLLLFLAGCDTRKRERELDARAKQLTEKEQQLLLFEQQLKLKEEEIVRREQELSQKADTTADSTTVINANMTGKWSVLMKCTETTCEGFALGDTKTEQWTISYENNSVVAQAIVDSRLVRTYTGTYTQEGLQLEAQPEPTAANTKMTATLRLINPTLMEGRREIIREGNCRVVYSLTANQLQ